MVGGGLEQFSVSPRPLGFGFGAKGLGSGLDNVHQVLIETIDSYSIFLNHNPEEYTWHLAAVFSLIERYL